MKLMYDTTEISFEQELTEGSSKKYRIKGIFSSPDKQNRNGRVYPMSLWEREVEKYQDVLKNGHPNSLMELNHPSRTAVDMMEAVAKMEKLWIENGYVMGEAVLLDNPKANQLKTLIDNGIKMSVSSRGVGNIKNGLVESFNLVTFDIIPNLAQSDFSAEMYGIVEGVLQNKEFTITESGNIEEIKMCSESSCGTYKKEEISEAFLSKFKEVLKGASKDLSESKSWNDCEKVTKKVANLFKGHSKITSTNSLKIEVDGVVGKVTFDPSYEL